MYIHVAVPHYTLVRILAEENLNNLIGIIKKFQADLLLFFRKYLKSVIVWRVKVLHIRAFWDNLLLHARGCRTINEELLKYCWSILYRDICLWYNTRRQSMRARTKSSSIIRFSPTAATIVYVHEFNRNSCPSVGAKQKRIFTQQSHYVGQQKTDIQSL